MPNIPIPYHKYVQISLEIGLKLIFIKNSNSNQKKRNVAAAKSSQPSIKLQGFWQLSNANDDNENRRQNEPCPVSGRLLLQK